MMIKLIQAEYIKGKHSFAKKCLFVFPLLVSVLAVVLMGGSLTQIGAYNWWYMMFLPVCVAFICIHLIEPEKKMHFFNLSILPIQKEKLWISKVYIGFCYLIIGNLVLFLLTTLSGALFGAQYSILRGIAAALVLSITWAWQIPLGMFLTTKFNSVITFLGIVILNILCSTQNIAGGNLWFIPFAIPSRLMAAILGINPNGVPMTLDSPLHNPNVILPGIIITTILFIISVIATKKWFNRSGE